MAVMNLYGYISAYLHYWNRRDSVIDYWSNQTIALNNSLKGIVGIAQQGTNIKSH